MIRGGAFVVQVVDYGDVMMLITRKELLLTPFENTLFSRCHGVMFYEIKSALRKTTIKL